MTTKNLIINGVDHAKFELEWVKKGGVVYRIPNLAHSKKTDVCGFRNQF